MRRIYATSLRAAAFSMLTAMAFSLNAQQVENGSFEEWKETAGSSASFGTGSGYDSPLEGEMRQRPGTEPTGWNGSSVNQMVFMEVTNELVGKCEGVSGAGVQLVSHMVGAFGIGSVAPGFLTFGTPWVYAELNLDNCDGGMFGGKEFSYLPDAVVGDFKRVDTNDEDSHIIAYLWEGTFKSPVGGKADPQQMRDDVDRAVLGKAEASEKGQLIASVDYAFKSTNGEWQTIVAPLEYAEDIFDEETGEVSVAPEKCNIIISCGEYWDRSKLVENTELLVDNVRFAYFSRIRAIAFEDGSEFDLTGVEFDENGVAEVTVPNDYMNMVGMMRLGHDMTMDFTKCDFEYGEDGTTVKTATFCFINNNGEDIDGLSSHTYRLTFTGEKADTEYYEGLLNIYMFGAPVTEDFPATIEIVPAGEGKVDFRLPNFSLAIDDGEPTYLGDIEVPEVEVTTTDDMKRVYKGGVEGLTLADGAIVADVEVEGTSDEAGNMEMKIAVLWNGITIDVNFSGKKASSGITSVIVSDENAPVEYFNLKGMKVAEDNLTPGLYIRRQGMKSTKVVVK